MVRIFYLISLLIVITCCINESKNNFSKILFNTIDHKIDSLNLKLNELTTSKDSHLARNIFFEARLKYKSLEPFIEYYFQGFSRKINGPALPDIKTDDNIVFNACGFQVLEEIIFQDSIQYEELKKETLILITDLLFIKQSIKDLPILDHHFYEIIQHQIIRIASLGLTGFDSPIALNSIPEAQSSLDAIREYFILYIKYNKLKNNSDILEFMDVTNNYLLTHKDFNSFNRLIFIKEYLMPISQSLQNEFQAIVDSNHYYKHNKVFFGSLSDLMQGKSFNPDAYSGYDVSKSSTSKVELGKKLFNSSLLSKGNKMSCATCHKAELAFTDGKVKSISNIHGKTISRNAPTLVYSSFQKAFFYDMRSQDLENQVESVLKNPDEFNSNIEEILQKLKQDTCLTRLFHNSFPDNTNINLYEIKNSIATYVRSLMPFTSKIDQYFKGENTLSTDEMNGFNLFTGKAKCATCHFIPLYNGTIPPWFNNTESEVIGVPQSVRWEGAQIDSDLGRYSINQIEELRFSFKTPSIRNIAFTSPYMHNGVYKNLEEVIKFYNLGGGLGIGIDLKHQTLPSEKLNLSKKEEQELIAFLKTLSDENK